MRMTRKLFHTVWIGAALVIAAFVHPAQAQSQKVDGIVKQMTDALAAAQNVSFHVEKMFDVVLNDGLKVQYSGAIDIEMRRPDRLYESYGDDLSAKEAWYDGQRFTLYDHIAEVYGELPSAGSIDATLDEIREKYGVLMPLAELLSSDAYDSYSQGVIEAVYAGQHDVNGVSAHHVMFIGTNAVWQIWIDAGEVPLPLKLVVAQPDVPGYPQHIFFFSDWDLSADLPDDDFVAEIPEGASRVSFLPKEE
jgi:hypothetical protein